MITTSLIPSAFRILFKIKLMVFILTAVYHETLQAQATVTLTTTALSAGNIFQGSYDIAYILRMDVTTASVTLTSASIVSGGTYDNNDITIFWLYRNTSPTVSGAGSISSDNTSTGNGETVSFPVPNPTFAVGTHYLLVTAHAAGNATDDNTLHFDGGTNPMSLTFTTSPNVTNNQSNNAGVKTIQAADITLTTTALSAGNIFQGSYDIAYILRMDVTTASVMLTSASIVSGGTYDNNDITIFWLYKNTSPTVSGAGSISSDNTSTGNGETVSYPVANQTFAVGTHYLLVTAHAAGNATDDNTLHFDGGTNPMSLTFTTSPNVTNNQSNNAGVKTIQAADVTFTTETVAAGPINTGSNNNIIYIVKMELSTASVTMNAFSIISSGTYDNNDITSFWLFRNTSPTLSGASSLANDMTSAGNGETITFNPSSGTFSVGTYYLMVTADVSATGTHGNTIQFVGTTNNAATGFTTSPNITDNQSNNAGLKTIFNPLPIELTTFTAREENGSVRLEWQTASELNNRGFEVQSAFGNHGLGGLEWQSIGLVAGGGSTSKAHSYSFFDKTAKPGINYYRLLQLDFYGGFEYSRTISLLLKENGLRLYPNPTSDVLGIKGFQRENAFVTILDSRGKTIFSGEISVGDGISLGHLPRGVYYVAIRGMLMEKVVLL